MNKIYCLLFFIVLAGFSACNLNTVADSTQSVPGNNWLYNNPAKTQFEISDTLKTYAVKFNLRHTVDYRYSNLFVLLVVRGKDVNKKIRYELKLATQTGEWLGKGSGDIYSKEFTLLKDLSFKHQGTYTITIEQNMRDNPLIGISDVGLQVVKN
ncbi:gliding motility lipoprotein GldH [Pedobacter montanisoli]|uniref:Gliding motility lipoprotein GldH n=1 Tax=Pedobacter montanisoli TaxID=2923277 RepID=A0ABS9ZU33_9SPHI|nr:gliding motility lipoprotein GldH [Pedobacter montanisoli]MCJ0741823.1 gliding motility lipoprotein GldH [Pedobacter montanisoli]